jgi:hypothetical protein
MQIPKPALHTGRRNDGHPKNEACSGVTRNCKHVAACDIGSTKSDGGRHLYASGPTTARGTGEGEQRDHASCELTGQ